MRAGLGDYDGVSVSLGRRHCAHSKGRDFPLPLRTRKDRLTRRAARMAAKKTHDLTPLCHPLAITKVEIDIVPDADAPGLVVRAAVKVTGQTGVEMEALTAVNRHHRRAFSPQYSRCNRSMGIEKAFGPMTSSPRTASCRNCRLSTLGPRNCQIGRRPCPARRSLPLQSRRNSPPGGGRRTSATRSRQTKAPAAAARNPSI
jgi:MoaC family